MDHRTHRAEQPGPGAPDGAVGRAKHWLMMLLCCLPMIAIAILVVIGLWT